MVETEKKLSELAEIMEVLPQALVNAKVPNHKKEKYMAISAFSNTTLACNSCIWVEPQLALIFVPSGI